MVKLLNTFYSVLSKLDQYEQNLRSTSTTNQNRNETPNSIERENSTKEVNEYLIKIGDAYLKLEDTLVDQLENRLTEEVRLAKFQYLKALYEFYSAQKTLQETYYELLKRFNGMNQEPPKQTKIPELNLSVYNGMDKSLRIFETEILKAYYHGVVHENIRYYIDTGKVISSNEDVRKHKDPS